MTTWLLTAPSHIEPLSQTHRASFVPPVQAQPRDVSCRSTMWTYPHLQWECRHRGQGYFTIKAISLPQIHRPSLRVWDDDERSVLGSPQPHWRKVPTQRGAGTLHCRAGCWQTLRAQTEQENSQVETSKMCLVICNSYSNDRIFTVILYMFSVSLGAILLSLYYVFIWKNPHTSALDRAGLVVAASLCQPLTVSVCRTTWRRLTSPPGTSCWTPPAQALRLWSSSRTVSTSTRKTVKYFLPRHFLRRSVKSLLVSSICNSEH